MTTTEKCPRCGNPLRDELQRPALSRYDNETMVCSSCGTAEALADAQGVALTPLDQLVSFEGARGLG